MSRFNKLGKGFEKIGQKHKKQLNTTRAHTSQKIPPIGSCRRSVVDNHAPCHLGAAVPRVMSPSSPDENPSET